MISQKNNITQFQKISIDEMITEFNRQAKRLFIEAQLEIEGIEVELEETELSYGKRLWFKCPNCGGSKRILYRLEPKVVCRSCFGLK